VGFLWGLPEAFVGSRSRPSRDFSLLLVGGQIRSSARVAGGVALLGWSRGFLAEILLAGCLLVRWRFPGAAGVARKRLSYVSVMMRS